MLTSHEINVMIKNYINSKNYTVLDCDETSENKVEIEFLLTENNKKQRINFVKKQFINYFELKYQHEKKSFNNTFNTTHFIPCYFSNGNLYVPEEIYISTIDCKSKSFTFDEIKLVLETLAQCHSEGICNKEEISKKLDEFKLSTKILDSFLFEVLESLIDLLPENNKLTNGNFKENSIKIIEDIINKPNNFRKILCHGYLCRDTILFKYQNDIPVECKFLDFNQQNYSSPICDVLQFIYMVTNTEFRKEHLNELLEFYYDRIKINLNERNLDIERILPFEQEYEASINYFLPLIKFQTACARLVQCLKPELQEICLGNHNLFVETFKADENYKASVMNCLKDLKNLIINPGLSLEDIYKIITNKLGNEKYDLLDYEFVPIGEVSGFFGEHKKLKVNISLNNKKRVLNFFVKFTPKGEAQKSIADDCGSFYKENFFYRHFVPVARKLGATIINDCTVPCYFTRLNDVLVFEDLNIDNYSILDHRKPLEFEVVAMVVKQMAKLHASSIILEDKMSVKQKTRYCLKEHYREGLAESFFTKKANHQGGKSIEISIECILDEIDLFPDNASILPNEDFKKKIKRLYERVYTLVKPSEEFRNTLCHGDPWINNILIQKNNGKPTDCKLIDFQLMRYCPPAQDLLGFIYLTTNRKFRQNHLDEILGVYYGEFSKALEANGCDVEKIYSRDVFNRSIEYMLPQAIGQTVIYYHICVTNPELMTHYTADEAKMRQIFLEDRRDFVAEMCQRDPIYKERNGEAIEDLREICARYF